MRRVVTINTQGGMNVKRLAEILTAIANEYTNTELVAEQRADGLAVYLRNNWVSK